MKILLDKHLIINKIPQDKINKTLYAPYHNNQPDQMNQEMTSSSQSLTALQIVIISISVLVFMLAITYLIMSKFGSKTLVETFYGAKPTAIYAVINVVGTILLVCALVLSSNALLSSI